MIDIWKVILIILAASCFLSFTWAIKSHFSVGEGLEKSAGMRTIAILGSISFIFVVSGIAYRGDAYLLVRIAALFMYTVSFSIFWWAVRATNKKKLTLAFANDEPIFLIQTGPYYYVRHPFYLAYSLFWIAGALAGTNLFLVIIPIVMIGLYYRAAKFEERKFTSSDFLKHDYELYKRHTGILLPKLGVNRDKGLHPS